jgi:hypothetical protein
LAAPGQTPLGATKTRPRQQNDRGSPSNPSEGHSEQSKISKQLQTAKNQPTSNISQKAKEKPIRKANRAIKSKRKPPDNPSPEGKDIITKDIRRKDRKYPTSSGTDGCNSATFNLKNIAFHGQTTDCCCCH